MIPHDQSPLSEFPLPSKKTKRLKKTKWTKKESKLLVRLVETQGEKWTRISKMMSRRTAKQCMQKYSNLVKVKKKGNWEYLEDRLVIGWIKVHGPRKWTECARRVKGRCGKQCRERWINFLDPNIKKGKWDEKENQMFFGLVKQFGSSWASIARNVPFRSENSVKNFFYSSIRALRTNRIFLVLKIVIFGPNSTAKGKVLFYYFLDI